MTEPIVNPLLVDFILYSRIRNSPRPLDLDGTRSQLPLTRNLLQGIALATDSEMRTLGYDDAHPNPIEAILHPKREHALIARLTQAVDRAARESLEPV